MRRSPRRRRHGHLVLRGVGALLLAGTVALAAAAAAWPHAGVVRSSPLAGSRLGASPTSVALTFSEQPEASLSEVRVLDRGGREVQIGRATAVPGEPGGLSVPVRQLPRGVYTVRWRTVSAVDGHATAGAYAFGVGVSPADAGIVVASASPAASRLEMLARWLFLGGLVLLIGAATAAAAGFGGGGRPPPRGPGPGGGGAPGRGP